jgi:hypothetical protein
MFFLLYWLVDEAVCFIVLIPRKGGEIDWVTFSYCPDEVNLRTSGLGQRNCEIIFLLSATSESSALSSDWLAASDESGHWIIKVQIKQLSVYDIPSS